MGVPAFFRWLSRKYPSVIVECIEQKPIVTDGVCVPVNSADPNPNGVEFDNLYLDMNGIIHPCTHPEDKPAPKDEDEMMEAIFECIDRLFRIVRPRKLLYMAIDGVAPRAKMNQQRSRRFRASKETSEKINEIDRIRSELAGKGVFLPPEKPKEEHFDSNCITPGTPFMARLSSCLHYYIHERLNNDPGWKNIKVILSDANVPGEGEHKIMDFIRRQRAQPDHDPNTQHVLCGADADLIMLGLATHEPNFTIIREEFKPNKPKPCDICGQLGHEMRECTGAEPNQKPEENTYGSECQYIFVRLNVLREYLERELYMPNLPFKYDFERAVDDWVFMCFFVGNDFLPHLPSLEIREGAIDRLVNLYKKAVYKTGGFLTDSGDVNLDRVQVIMSDLGDAEDEIFKRRQQNELAFKQREKDKKRRNEIISNFKPKWIPTGQFAPNALGQPVKPIENARYEAYQMRMQGRNYNTSAENANANHDLESMLIPENTSNRGQKRKINEVEEDSDDDQSHDEVRLWEDGFKDRYYESKFDVSPDNLAFRNNVALQYVRGLCWVLRYYYQGCASWRWYFPYHYAPFASDFINIGGLSTEFEKGTEPFRPLEQLMGVFPAASSKHVPAPWAKLMIDPKSHIIDFYPEDFKIDLNGKKFAWQGVALLPFVDENRLFKALAPYYDSLTEAEKKRNVRGNDRLYVGTGNSGYNFVKGLYTNRVEFDKEIEISIDGMRGTLLLSEDCVNEGGTLVSPVRGLPVRNNKIYCVKFKDPKYSNSHIFLARKLKGAKEPPRVLKPQDFDAMNRNNGNQWKPQIGFTRPTQSASLGQAGHRMLEHHTNRIRSPMYANIPPPMGLYQSYGKSKKKWKKLQAKLCKENKKLEARSVQAAEKLKNWKFQDVMSFLVPKEGETVTSVRAESDVDVDGTSNISVGEENNSCDLISQANEEETSSLRSFARSISTPVSQKPTKVRKKCKNKRESASATAMDHSSNNNQADTQPANEIDLFFNCIAATVKKLRPYNQLIAKTTVFSIISQLEMVEMSATSQFPPSATTPTPSQPPYNTLAFAPPLFPQNAHTSAPFLQNAYVPPSSETQSLRRSARLASQTPQNS